EESRVKSDSELVRSLRPSLASTHGRLICVGTPYAARGFAYSTFKANYGNDQGTILVWSGPSLLMNSTLDEKIVQRDIAQDPVAASVEYVVEIGRWREDVCIFVSRQTVEECVIPGRLELPPRDGVVYSCFVDMSGGRNDDSCLAIAHKEGTLIV